MLLSGSVAGIEPSDVEMDQATGISRAGYCESRRSRSQAPDGYRARKSRRGAWRVFDASPLPDESVRRRRPSDVRPD